MKRASQRRLQRKRIFIGGEGASECNYVKWLRDLCRDKNIPVTFDIHDLGSGRDPLNRITKAAKKIKYEENIRERYQYKFLFFDNDQIKNVNNENIFNEKANKTRACRHLRGGVPARRFV